MLRISWNQPGLDPGSMTPEFLSSFKLRPAPLEVWQEHWYIFPNESGKWTLTSRWGRKIGALLELWQDPRYSSRAETGMSGNFLSCIKGVKDPLEAQEGKWDFSQEATAEKGLISCWGENLLDFLELRWETWGSSWVTTGISGTCSCYLRKVHPMRVVRGLSGFLSSQCLVLGPHLELRPKPQCSPPMLTWISGFLLNFNSGVRPHLVWRHASSLSSRALKVVSGFLWSDIGICGFLLRCPVL